MDERQGPDCAWARRQDRAGRKPPPVGPGGGPPTADTEKGLSRAFFDLQLDFACAAAARSGLPRARALLDYTNLYVRFGLGRDFDAAHPVWRNYLAGLAAADDAGELTHRFYLARPPAPPPGIVATFGCFSYAWLDDERLRLHFANVEPDGRSPLGPDRGEQRRAELTALFAHVARTPRRPARVVGASWLYHLDAYRRLFPEPYLATARVLRGRFRHMPLWGQFVDRRGEVREGPARELRERLARQSSPEGLDDCFPLPVLGLEAPARVFCEFYGA